MSPLIRPDRGSGWTGQADMNTGGPHELILERSQMLGLGIQGPQFKSHGIEAGRGIVCDQGHLIAQHSHFGPLGKRVRMGGKEPCQGAINTDRHEERNHAPDEGRRKLPLLGG